MLNIIFLGLVSFFTDFGTEMVYPLIPLYLTSAFGATPVIVGVIEGMAESLASLLKVFGGYISDRFKKNKVVAFLGYATGLIYKLVLLVAGSWGGVLVARIIDRLGKGIRTAPRDVLVSESADKSIMGWSFGIHKALDMAGAALGILVTYFLLRRANGSIDYSRVFIISIAPALLGLCMFFFIKEKKEPRQVNTKEPFWKSIRQVDSQLKLYLFVVFVFTLGNSSNSFLLLKAKAAGFDDVNVVLLYFIYNMIASILSIPFGKWSDGIGRKKLLVVGYFVFALCYLGFAFSQTQSQMILVFALYGAYTAMVAGVERAFVVEVSPAAVKGTMLGLHATITGIALLPASVFAGFLWSHFGAVAPFVFGASMSLLAALILLFFMKGQPKQVHQYQ